MGRHTISEASSHVCYHPKVYINPGEDVEVSTMKWAVQEYKQMEQALRRVLTIFISKGHLKKNHVSRDIIVKKLKENLKSNTRFQDKETFRNFKV